MESETMIRNTPCNCHRTQPRGLAGFLTQDATGLVTYNAGDNPDPTYGGTYNAPAPDQIAPGTYAAGFTGLPITAPAPAINWQLLGYVAAGAILIAMASGSPGGPRRR